MPANAIAPHKTWTLVLVSLGLFMTVLDTLAVTTALPVLLVDLGADLAGLEWTVNAYNLAFACLLLTGAALGERSGADGCSASACRCSPAASAAAALSPGIGVLVGARVIQGAGAAIVMPLTLTLISEAFPAEKRGAAIGLWGGIAGLAVAAGPVVGGAVVSGLSWHWIFWLNVPIGLVLIPLAARRLSESFGPPAKLDLRGLALAAAGALGLTWGPRPRQHRRLGERRGDRGPRSRRDPDRRVCRLGAPLRPSDAPYRPVRQTGASPPSTASASS